MRNLKRALSLALASIMLLGMMVVGTSAASINDFSDADSVNNQEAVAIATGLGIFDGYDDGEFKPENVVTRAEMAVIICKILHGADVDPSNFTGVAKFTDVPAWAEGYVNMCASLGIIVGVGDGKFAPNKTVSTVEASTMLLKALGYFKAGEGDALGTDWELTVTSQATALGLYGDMVLGMNAGLTRDNVAEMTYNTLFAQRVAYDDYRGLYVKANDRSVVVTNGTVDPSNTLAQNTFHMYMVEGTVVANGMTDVKLAETSKSNAQTTVMFAEDTDLDQDGKAEYKNEETYDFEYATGLNMIGHAAKVYYTIEKKAPVVFAITDQATKVEIINYNANTTRLAEAANDAGFKKNTILDVEVDNYFLNYDLDMTVKAAEDASPELFDRDDMDTLLVISNSGNKKVDYVIALDEYLDVLDNINTRKADTVYTLADTAVTSKGMAIPQGEVAVGDFVIATKIGGKNDVVVFQTAETVNAEITKISGRSASTAYTTTVVADGISYKQSNVSAGDADVTAFADIDVLGTATLILGTDGKLVALSKVKAAPNYAYVAQFGCTHSTGAIDTLDTLTAHVYFADGTNGIYEVDLAKSDSRADGATGTNFFDTLDGDRTKIKAAAEKVGTMDKEYEAPTGPALASGALGLWDAKVQANGKVVLTALAVDESAQVDFTDEDNAGIRLVKGHSTLVIEDNADNVQAANGQIIYQNNDTVYFYVTGSYDSKLRVQVFTGIDNAYSFKTVYDNSHTTPAVDGQGILQLFVNEPEDKDGNPLRNTAKTMLVRNVVTVESDVYYYDQGDFDLNGVEGRVTITYNLHDKNGNPATVTYDNNGAYFANNGEATRLADELYSGYYTLGMDNLDRYVTLYGDQDENLPSGESFSAHNPAHDWATDNTGSESGTAYVVNDYAKYDEYTHNLFGELTKIGFNNKDTKVVDLTGNDFETVTDVVTALAVTASDGVHSILRISYAYANGDLTSKVMYVTDYRPDASEGTTTPSTMDNLLDTVKVNGFKQTVAGAYDTVAKAVANAQPITMFGNTSQQYKIELAAKNPGSGEYNGSFDMFANYTDARNGSVTVGTDTLTILSSSAPLSGCDPVPGSYLVIAISDGATPATTSYYAYTFVQR